MSASGLTRRRGAAPTAENGEEPSRVASPAPKKEDRAPETSYESGENGHKIAFDPRDISESAERSKQPKLTLMEEVLLLGLKDKQVRLDVAYAFHHRAMDADITATPGIPLVLERQHLIRPSRMYSHRTRFQGTDQHAKRLVETEVSAGRSSD